MKIALIGCGAMGSLYGGYLSKVHEVTVCDVSQALIDAINEKGIIMDEPTGETVVFKPVCATTDSSTVGEQDLVITFVNYKFLESALNTAKGMIGPNTIVMSLQNGMGNYDEIAKVVPEEQICCGTTAHGCTALEPGHVRHTGVGITAMGTIKGNPADAERVAEAMREAGFEVVVKENVLEVIWHKLFANIAINAITAILEQPNAVVADNEYAHEVAVNLVKEAIAVANATGCSFNEEAELKSAFDVAVATGTNRSSMLQCVDTKRPTEIAIINGAVCRIGREIGMPTPYNDVIVKLMEAKTSLYLKK
jgi:2-dehydropantoate 2-reductase